MKERKILYVPKHDKYFVQTVKSKNETRMINLLEPQKKPLLFSFVTLAKMLRSPEVGQSKLLTVLRYVTALMSDKRIITLLPLATVYMTSARLCVSY